MSHRTMRREWITVRGADLRQTYAHTASWVHEHNERQHNKHWPTHRSSREVLEERSQTASRKSLAETITMQVLFTLQAALQVTDCF